MQKPKPTLCLKLLAAGAIALAANPAFSQGYPSRPVHVITAEPGGGTDVVARIIAQGMTANMGQQVVVENRGGASGAIAAQAVAKASPDGYTLLLYSGNLWLLPFLRSNVQFDPLKDFSPITLATNAPNIFAVHPSVPANSVKEFIALAKARPAQLNYSSGGAGTTPHLAGELLKAMAGINIVHVPYKSGGGAINALIAGEVQIMFANVAAMVPHIKARRIKALAIASAETSELLPDLPTMAASGLAGYTSELSVGIFAPAGTAPTLVNRLNQEILRVLNRPDVKEKFFSLGAITIGSTPEQLAENVKSEMAKWGKVIKDAGIRED